MRKSPQHVLISTVMKKLALGLLSKPVLVAELGENLWGNYSKVSAYVSLSISTVKVLCRELFKSDGCCRY